MTRLGHGYAPTSKKPMMASARKAIADTAKRAGLSIEETEFNYLFPDLQTNPNNRLATSPQTVANLIKLGEAMRDDPAEEAQRVGNSKIPAAFTYFGQFLDHDITLDASAASMADLSDPNLQPLDALVGLENARSSTLDLDSVYGGPRDPANPDKMQVGPVSPTGNPNPPTAAIPGKSRFNDLPRKPRSADRNEDRSALIGDPRNDENTIVAQLHTAFLKAHNTLVDQGMNFEKAKKELIKRYQNIVINDFLPRICEPKVVKECASSPAKYYSGEPFMPIEFAVAAYRFGHSMVRTNYDFNNNFSPFTQAPAPVIPATLNLLFTFTALSGQLGFGTEPPDGFDTLPENWVIQWERISDVGPNPQMARSIDARLTPMLFELKNPFGQLQSEDEAEQRAKDIAPKLAIRNLLRGYHLGLPTGQAVANRLGVPALSGQALIDALPTQALKDAAQPFKDRTPLWFYVLAEAGNPKGAAGQHLGSVGSWIVSETLVNLIRQSPISVLGKDKDPALVSFKLSDLLKLAAKQDEALISTREPLRKAS